MKGDSSFCQSDLRDRWPPFFLDGAEEEEKDESGG